MLGEVDIVNNSSQNSMDTESDRRYYDSSKGISEAVIRQFSSKIGLYFNKYKHVIEKRFKSRQNVRVLELGAGSCSLSLMLSQLPCVSDVVCFDVSAVRMREITPISARVISSHPEKLQFVQGDMGDSISFEDGSFDLIVFDASLHHTRSMWRTLSECKRILALDGLIVAQREQYLGVLTFSRKLRQLVESEEVRGGVSENAYLKAQYQYYFQALGFRTHFIPVGENLLQKLLMPFNGLIYSKWVLVAHKTD